MTRNKAVLAVFACALIVRAGVLVRLSGRPDALLRTDSKTYLLPARNLLARGVFSSEQAPPYAPEPKRTPGYPLFLAACMAVSPSPAFSAAVQAAFDAATAALAGLAAALISGNPAAAFAGLLYALDPASAAQAPLILSEPIFTFLLALAVVLLLGEKETPRTAAAAACGLCLGLATLVRPISLYLWLPWSAALAWSWPGRWRKRALAFAAAAALLPAAWCARNAALFGSFEFSSITGLNALLWEAAAVQATADGVPLETGRQAMKDELKRRHPGEFSGPFDESHARAALAREVVLRHPLAAARLHAVSTLKMLLGPGLNEIAKALSPDAPLPSEESMITSMSGAGTFAVLKARPRLWVVLVTEGLILGATYLLAVLGAWRLWLGRRRLEAAAVAVPLLYLLVLSAGGWSYYRFRLPLLPLLIMLGAAAWPKTKL